MLQRAGHNVSDGLGARVATGGLWSPPLPTKFTAKHRKRGKGRGSKNTTQMRALYNKLGFIHTFLF